MAMAGPTRGVYTVTEIMGTWSNYNWFLDRQFYLYTLTGVIWSWRLVCMVLLVRESQVDPLDPFLLLPTGQQFCLILLAEAIHVVIWFLPIAPLQMRTLTFRSIMLYSHIAGCVCGILAIFSTNLFMFVLLQSVADATGMHCYFVFVIAIGCKELDCFHWGKSSLLIDAWKCLVCVFYVLVGNVAVISLGPLAKIWQVRNFTGSMLSLGYALIIWLFVIDSPRELVRRSRQKEAVAVLQTFASKTGNTLPPNFRGLRAEVEDEQQPLLNV